MLIPSSDPFQKFYFFFNFPFPGKLPNFYSFIQLPHPAPPELCHPFSRLCHSTLRYRWLASSVCLTQPVSSLAGRHASHAPQRPRSLGPGGQSPQMSAPRLIAAAAADKGPVYSGHLVGRSVSRSGGNSAERTPGAVTALRPHPSGTDGNPVTREKFPGIKIRRPVSRS